MISKLFALEPRKTLDHLLTQLRVLVLKHQSHDEGQDIAEYAVMVAVILIIVVGTIRLIGTNANTVFSNVASAVQ